MGGMLSSLRSSLLLRCTSIRSSLRSFRPSLLLSFAPRLAHLLALSLSLGILPLDKLLLEVLVEHKLNATLRATPVARRDAPVEAPDSLLPVYGANRVGVGSVGLLANGSVREELHASLHHPNRIRYGVTGETGHDSRNRGVEVTESNLGLEEVLQCDERSESKKGFQ